MNFFKKKKDEAIVFDNTSNTLMTIDHNPEIVDALDDWKKDESSNDRRLATPIPIMIEAYIHNLKSQNEQLANAFDKLQQETQIKVLSAGRKFDYTKLDECHLRITQLENEIEILKDEKQEIRERLAGVLGHLSRIVNDLPLDSKATKLE